jgi:glycosyltransferase involved in cell wall biosynthesis/CDP-glycerol glycerophosphotransferase (TagB/SpsB family)
VIKKPKISVIMPVYNVEEYLEDAIESVINQTIGFDDNIELILVNDGSRDGSGDICEQYKTKYPNNVLYIKQKNQGLSATRYNGFLRARGEYIHSLDSDDTISNNYYEEIVKFFRTHKNEVDIVASKVLFFEARTGDHYLNYRFKTTRVIDIKAEPLSYQYQFASCVIRRNAILPEWFDKNISIAEDARLIAIILKQKKAYGAVSNIAYHYRIRESGNSLINTQHEKIDFYTETPKRYWQFIINLWREEDGSLEPFIQRSILNDIQWRLNEQHTQKVLNSKEEQDYKNIVFHTASQFDDSIILSQERLGIDKKIAILRHKYGSSFERNLKIENSKYMLNGNILFDYSDYINASGLTLDFIHEKDSDQYFIEGYPTNDRLHSEDKIYLRTESGGDVEIKYVERIQRRKDAFLGDSFHKEEAFEAEVSIAKNDTLRAVMKAHDGSEIQIPLHTKRHTKISTFNRSYRVFPDRIFRKKIPYIAVTPYSKHKHIMYELVFLLQILRNVRLRDTYRLLRNAVDMFRYSRAMGSIDFKETTINFLKPVAFFARTLALNGMSIVYRILYHSLRGLQTNKYPIWIISDRGIAGGDNGEAFFKYITTLKNPKVRYYFAINKSSKDYKRLKKIGPVVRMGSFRYKLLFLQASKLISSQADEYVINPFGMREPQLLDLFTFDFIFLQHGVTKNDISDWLNRFFKNIRLFITVSEKEYNSILEYPFYYSPEEVLLSGFPRYDLLISEPKNKVMLAPTWRKYLTSGKLGADGRWTYMSTFKKSEYFNFYNNLMNDKRIHDVFEKYNVMGELYIHPSHSTQTKDFKENDHFKIKKFPYDYKKAYKESNLLITDYSSVYFDFSYLNKPMIYTAFDREYFFENHGVYVEGYFDERRDGFGPVAQTYEATVQEIIKSVKDGFKLQDIYQERINKFFKYRDTENSKRVYEAIQVIEKLR